jgi:hypothetical protein
MSSNIYKNIVLIIVGVLLGWLICRFCCNGCGGGGCEKGGAACHKSMCEHGGACCSGEGKCDKADCDHKMGGACCKGGGHGEGKAACNHGGHGDMHADDKVHVIIDGLKEKNFQGDTVIAIDGGTVHVTRTGDKMEVKVEMKDSVQVEKAVEVHAH